MKKNKFNFLGAMRSIAIITLVAVIVFLYISCDSGNEKEPELKTPTINDFNISGLGTFTYDGTEKKVTITAKEGKTIGSIYVKYNGGVYAPKNAGTYIVTFDVYASYGSGWNSASDLPVGTLVINPTNSATSTTYAKTISVVNSDVYVLSSFSWLPFSYGKFYWKNGEKLEIPDDGIGYAMTVKDSDVFIVGSYNNGTEHIACYWKNGIKTDLSTINSQASVITVEGSDVYTAGLYNSINGNIPCYWKNGEKIDLALPWKIEGTKHIILAEIYGIVVVGSDVHVAGYCNILTAQNYNDVCYWKNGTRVDYSFFASNANANDSAIVNGFAVSGSDIYFAGSYNSSGSSSVDYGCYWKNETRIIVPSCSEVKAFKISGSDLYITGTNSDRNGICYWKNDTRIFLSFESLNAATIDIFIADSDVYVLGSEYNGAFHVACYWKNGVKVDLGVE